LPRSLALLRYVAGNAPEVRIFAQLPRFRPLPEPKNHGSMTDPYRSMAAGYPAAIPRSRVDD